MGRRETEDSLVVNLIFRIKLNRRPHTHLILRDSIEELSKFPHGTKRHLPSLTLRLD